MGVSPLASHCTTRHWASRSSRAWSRRTQSCCSSRHAYIAYPVRQRRRTKSFATQCQRLQTSHSIETRVRVSGSLVTAGKTNSEEKQQVAPEVLCGSDGPQLERAARRAKLRRQTHGSVFVHVQKNMNIAYTKQDGGNDPVLHVEIEIASLCLGRTTYPSAGLFETCTGT